MRVIALEMGFYNGSRQRPGSEFDMNPLPDGSLPKWVVAADDNSRVEIARNAARAAQRDFDAMVAAAGPKRGGRPGVTRVNTGLADATAASEPAVAVTPSWYKSTKVEEAVAGVKAAPIPAPIDEAPLA
jgi:hypothetical protein